MSLHLRLHFRPQLTTEQSQTFQDIMLNASIANPQWFAEKKRSDECVYFIANYQTT